MTRVSDAQRERLEHDYYAALVILYGTAFRETVVRGALNPGIDETRVLTELRAFAHEQAVLDQEGINVRITAVLQEVQHPDLADQMLVSLRNDFEDYFKRDKGLYMASTAFHQGQHDAITNATNQDGQPLAKTAQYEWRQYTNQSDSCADAMSASPASYADLLDLAGSPPPVHRGCRCSLSPV